MRSDFGMKTAVLMLLCLLPLTAFCGGRAEGSRMSTPFRWLAQVDSNGAARAVERATGGRVLSVNREDSNGRVVYRVKVLLPGGRIRVVTVDGETGSVGG